MLASSSLNRPEQGPGQRAVSLRSLQMVEPTAPAPPLSPSVVRPVSGWRAWAERQAVPLFIGLTLAWSWGWWSLLWSYGGQGVLRQGAPAEAFLIAAVGGCGPSLAGLVLTALLQGRAGLAQLRRRFGLWRLGRVWLLLGVAPLASLLLPLLRTVAGAPLDAAGWLDLLLPGLLLARWPGRWRRSAGGASCCRGCFSGIRPGWPRSGSGWSGVGSGMVMRTTSAWPAPAGAAATSQAAHEAIEAINRRRLDMRCSPGSTDCAVTSREHGHPGLRRS